MGSHFLCRGSLLSLVFTLSMTSMVEGKLFIIDANVRKDLLPKSTCAVANGGRVFCSATLFKTEDYKNSDLLSTATHCLDSAGPVEELSILCGDEIRKVQTQEVGDPVYDISILKLKRAFEKVEPMMVAAESHHNKLAADPSSYLCAAFGYGLDENGGIGELKGRFINILNLDNFGVLTRIDLASRSDLEIFVGDLIMRENLVSINGSLSGFSSEEHQKEFFKIIDEKEALIKKQYEDLYLMSDVTTGEQKFMTIQSNEGKRRNIIDHGDSGGTTACLIDGLWQLFAINSSGEDGQQGFVIPLRWDMREDFKAMVARILKKSKGL